MALKSCDSWHRFKYLVLFFCLVCRSLEEKTKNVVHLHMHVILYFNLHVELLIRDTHIMLFKVPIMLCSDSQHQANYAHHFVPVMLTLINSIVTIR